LGADAAHGLASANLQTPKVSQPQAAKLLNVSPRIVADAKEIERDAPELAYATSPPANGQWWRLNLPTSPMVATAKAISLQICNLIPYRKQKPPNF
jgi:hypothetical protein